MTVIYGIKNCDTMKKAFKWLEDAGIEFEFHDYKKSGVPENVIRAAIKHNGWDNVINRRGTTWRKLPDEVKASMDEKAALRMAQENPSIIKRPLLVQGASIHLGFDPEDYRKIFS